MNGATASILKHVAAIVIDDAAHEDDTTPGPDNFAAGGQHSSRLCRADEIAIHIHGHTVDRGLHSPGDHEQGIVRKGHQRPAVNIAPAIAILGFGNEAADQAIAFRLAVEWTSVLLEVIDGLPMVPGQGAGWAHPAAACRGCAHSCVEPEAEAANPCKA